MKYLPNILQAQAARTVAAAAIVVALAVALPSIAMGTGGGQIAASAPSVDKQTVAQAATKSAPATKSTAMSKTTNDSHAERVEARIKDLHSKLKISAAQEDKWNAVIQVMRDNARTMDSLTQPRIQNANSMTAVDDVKSYSQIADAHAEG